MIVVTGAAGFIGSCVVKKLNDDGFTDLILVDHLDDPFKNANLENKSYAHYLEKDAFLKLIEHDQILDPIDAVIHMGACSSTTLQDAEYYRTNNLEYSKSVANWCLDKNSHLIYASSAATYGNGQCGYRDDNETIKQCQPLNLYGQSKQDFDLWILEQGLDKKFVGLKFFNVFGPNEYHKADMRSVVLKSFPLVKKEGVMKLFRSYRPDFADGGQQRDFIYVKDVVDVINFFFENQSLSGIYNVGTGLARSWNDVAHALFSAIGKPTQIEYIDMPDVLKDKYQYFTEAEVDKLRAAGYQNNFTPLEDAVKDYVGYLEHQRHW